MPYWHDFDWSAAHRNTDTERRGITVDRKIILGVALTFGCAMLSGQAFAYSTSLINFPIADMLKHREGLHIFGGGGYARNVNKGFSWYQTSTFGLFDKAEVGFSNDFLGSTLLDAKVQIYDAPKQGVSVSFGINRYDTVTRTSDTYVAFRKDMGNFRFHAQAYKADKIVGVFGVDFGCANGWSGAIEHVTGHDSEIWLAMNSPVFADRFSIMLATRAPWDGGPGIQYQACLNYGFRF